MHVFLRIDSHSARAQDSIGLHLCLQKQCCLCSTYASPDTAGTIKGELRAGDSMDEHDHVGARKHLPGQFEPRASTAWSEGHLGFQRHAAARSGISSSMHYLPCADAPPVCDDTTAVRVLLGSAVVPQPFGPPLSLGGSGEDSSVCSRPPREALDVPPADRLEAHPDQFCMAAMCDVRRQLVSSQARAVPLWEKALQGSIMGAQQEGFTKQAAPPGPDAAWKVASGPSSQVPMPDALCADSVMPPERLACPPSGTCGTRDLDHRDRDARWRSVSTASLMPAADVAEPQHGTFIHSNHDKAPSLQNQISEIRASGSCHEDHSCHSSEPSVIALATAEVEADLSAAQRLQEHLMSEVNVAQVWSAARISPCALLQCKQVSKHVAKCFSSRANG